MDSITVIAAEKRMEREKTMAKIKVTEGQVQGKTRKWQPLLIACTNKLI